MQPPSFVESDSISLILTFVFRFLLRDTPAAADHEGVRENQESTDFCFQQQLNNYEEYSAQKALRTVHFLHTGVIPGCFSNQLKTKSVLLDEHCIPKLSDYGMSIIKEHIEKFETKSEKKSKSCPKTKMDDDVYNFGFILLESLVGPITRDKGETFFINEKASFGSDQDGRRKIVDPIVMTTCSQESLSIVISITTKCISQDSSSRPSFEDVLWNLQYAAQVQATSDADQKSD